MTVSTKYNAGDEVWYMMLNKPTKEPIWNIRIGIGSKNEVDIKYFFFRPRINDNHLVMGESEIYSSKEELLQTLFLNNVK